jgi:hypothetical protein
VRRPLSGRDYNLSGERQAVLPLSVSRKPNSREPDQQHCPGEDSIAWAVSTAVHANVG